MGGLVSPPRNGSRLPQSMTHDPRTSLPRRFTTDSGRVPTLSSITAPRVPDQTQDYASTYHKVQLLEKKKQEYEMIREQKRRFEVELQKHEQELAQMQEDLRGPMAGHQSEPTTPPEYSTSSLTSPPGLFNRPNRSGSQLASPQSGLIQNPARFGAELPSWSSVPGSRRNSDEDDKEEAVRQDPTSHRSTNALNRYSMPVTRTRNGLYDLGNLDGTNTTRFLFGDDDLGDSRLTATTTADDFPTLVRRDDPLGLSAIGSGQLNGNASAKSTNSLRHSLDLKYLSEASSDVGNSIHNPSANHVMATPPKLQNSYSTGDVNSVKAGSPGQNFGNSPNNHAQQHFHNHNASLGRFLLVPFPRERSHALELELDQLPLLSWQQLCSPNNSGPPTSTANAAFGVPLLAMGLQNMGLNNYPNNNYTGGYTPSYQGSSQQQRDSQARVIQHRRQLDNEGVCPSQTVEASPFGILTSPLEAMSRYHNLPIEAVVGQIYELCKDQHGCRYLQKKLEEQNPSQTHMVWLETNQHVVELMTDPFGNYLCQKLLEFCNNDERTVLIQNASVDMVRIALNQHGTRALQKMIEFVSTPDQVKIIVEALRNRVVELIQDLNGNHVIQKCLNKLSAADAQFIFDAVGMHCVEVGTHRHGCCVLQRCIDHANTDQKAWLITRITEHAHVLVQDPYGNYVIQYIIDLNEPAFTEPVVNQFRTHVSQLSRHKFSSNVIEKCLRCAQDPSKDMIVDEILAPGEIEKLIRDNYANYVIQTALEYATPYKKAALVDSIRPVLPSVRSTPYGRRIQAKIHNYDGRTSGQATPADAGNGQIPLRPSHNRGMSSGNVSLASVGNVGFSSVGNGLAGNLGGNGGNMPAPVSRNNSSQNGCRLASTAIPSLPGATVTQRVDLPAGAAPAADNGESQWL
ncbi:unnamed protein product [Parascedosporium putredinis]|uniref:PUM-HD domain-containing protein n=1 Tax=Parascedosporium putredinis TaxID=1442378 RepID=A0A9P1M8T2_9PEZI|nr:unnamed protein product [Parascedosporium putredinis]CAI7990532.1 unnamed protein product [Parascedosporium putredinis]